MKFDIKKFLFYILIFLAILTYGKKISDSYKEHDVDNGIAPAFLDKDGEAYVRFSYEKMSFLFPKRNYDGCRGMYFLCLHFPVNKKEISFGDDKELVVIEFPSDFYLKDNLSFSKDGRYRDFLNDLGGEVSDSKYIGFSVYESKRKNQIFYVMSKASDGSILEPKVSLFAICDNKNNYGGKYKPTLWVSTHQSPTCTAFFNFENKFSVRAEFFDWQLISNQNFKSDIQKIISSFIGEGQ